MLTLFRGCARLEYRNQTIKLLRAANGEITRTAFRRCWVDDEALDMLNSESGLIARIVNVDPTGTMGFPVRQALISDFHTDPETDTLHLTLMLDSFLTTLLDFDPRIASWGSGTNHPPDTFVTPWRGDWPAVDEVAVGDELGRWREAIDFLVDAWGLEETAFFRLAGDIIGHPTGPTLSIEQAAEATLRIVSYNPHLSQREVERRRLRLSQSGALVHVDPDHAIDRDGDAEIRVQSLEAGETTVQIGVEPDPQFNTYIPLTIASTISPGRPSLSARVLGPEWRNCLHELAERLDSDRLLLQGVLDLFERVFPHEPAIGFNVGRIRYLNGDLSGARLHFDTVLADHDDPDALAWRLYVALREGDVEYAQSALPRLNLSRNDLFEGLVEAFRHMDAAHGVRILDQVHDVFGDDKTLRLLTAASGSVDDEGVAVALGAAAARIDRTAAIRLLRDMLNHEPLVGWRKARTLLLELALEGSDRGDVEHLAASVLVIVDDDPSEALSRYETYAPLVDPETVASLALRNAQTLLLRGDSDARSTAFTFALHAGDAALVQARPLLAEGAVNLILANADPDDPAESGHLLAASALVERLHEVSTRLQPTADDDERIRRDTYRRLAAWLGGKDLILYGIAPEGLEHHLDAVEVRSYEFIPVGGDLRTVLEKAKPESTVLIGSWSSREMVPEDTIEWIFDSGITTMWSQHAGQRLLEAVLATFPVLDSAVRKVDLPQSYSEVIERGAALPGLALSGGIAAGVAELDALHPRPQHVRRSWRALELLSRYAEDKQANRSRLGLREWMKATGAPDSWYAANESEQTTGNDRSHDQRVFDVPTTVHPSGRVFMPAHLKLGNSGPAPRVHFLDNTGTDGTIYVGYLGPHLETSRKH
ncbi:hypothetical protein ACE2AJ_09820 [Aquihabitans daechungensis]|uniref:hypothetical protein n=1 Tax=Aquihabitans daechungensis TaxID=1052257 RepID=UPI003B9E35FF